MAKGGPRPGAGRKPGRPNATTAAQRAAVLASGLSPLDYLLGVMRDISNPDALRIEVAKAAAPYCHPRLAITQLDIDDSRLLSPEERRARIEELVGQLGLTETLN